MLVEKIAAEAGIPLLFISPSAILSKWSGESEKTLRWGGTRSLQWPMEGGCAWCRGLHSVLCQNTAWCTAACPGCARQAKSLDATSELAFVAAGRCSRQRHSWPLQWSSLMKSTRLRPPGEVALAALDDTLTRAGVVKWALKALACCAG